MSTASMTIAGSLVTINADGEWYSENSALAAVLNTSFGKLMYPDSPANPSPTYAQVRAAERAFDATAKWSGIVQDQEERVY